MSALIMKERGAACWKALGLWAEAASRLRISSVRLDCAPWALSDPTCNRRRGHRGARGRVRGRRSSLLTSSLSNRVIILTLGSEVRESAQQDSNRPWKTEQMEETLCRRWSSSCSTGSDLQGAVAAVQVVQTGREDELLVDPS